MSVGNAGRTAAPPELGSGAGLAGGAGEAVLGRGDGAVVGSGVAAIGAGVLCLVVGARVSIPVTVVRDVGSAVKHPCSSQSTGSSNVGSAVTTARSVGTVDVGVVGALDGAGLGGAVTVAAMAASRLRLTIRRPPSALSVCCPIREITCVRCKWDRLQVGSIGCKSRTARAMLRGEAVHAYGRLHLRFAEAGEHEPDRIRL